MMQTAVSFIPAHFSVREARQWAAAHDAFHYLVGSPDQLVGIISREQLEDPTLSEIESKSISSVASHTFTHAHPDHPVDIVLERLGENGGLLPVVSRSNARKVEGIITSESLLSWRTARRQRPTNSRDSVDAGSVRSH
jgi:CBS domain-containing protein